jgi:hypothetical protein
VQSVDEAVQTRETFAVENKYLDTNRRRRFLMATELLTPFRGCGRGAHGANRSTVEEACNSESVRVAIVEEIQRRGDALARNLAAIWYGSLLLYNVNALEPPRAQSAECSR